MKLLFSMAVVSGVFTLAGCSRRLHAGEATSTKDSMPVQQSLDQSVVNNMNSFSFTLMNYIQSELPPAENVFISPLSLHMDLGMLLNGSGGKTYAEITKVMEIDGRHLEKINAAYTTLLKTLPDADPKVQIGLYNSMWYRKGLKVKAGYTERLKSNFEAKIEGLAFKVGDEEIINKWASDKTNGKIPKVIDQIEDDQVMFLMNALYFRGTWSIQFKKEHTTETDFHLENGEASKVMMMNNTDTFYHYIDSVYAAVRLPYGNGRFSMTVILPASNVNLKETLSSFTIDTWDELQEKMRKSKVRIGLPRFTIPKFEIKLNPVLKKMGVQSAFNAEQADFAKMANTKNLALSFVKQDSYLRVDEEGTEAAAVTTGGMTVTSVPIIPSIRCDHPFAIIISDQTTNTILFMGKIMAPESDT